MATLCSLIFLKINLYQRKTRLAAIRTVTETSSCLFNGLSTKMHALLAWGKRNITKTKNAFFKLNSIFLFVIFNFGQ